MSTGATNWRALHGSAFKGAAVLVSGGAGFIGSHLVLALKALGARVSVFDDLSNSVADAERLLKPAKLIQGTILDPSALQQATQGQQYVFHLAALGSVPRSIEQPLLYHQVNATGTVHVLEAARAAGVKRVIYAASSSAYGDSPTLPKVETMPTFPLSPYAASKLAGEAYMAAYAKSFGLDTVCLRYFNIFGPRQRADIAYSAVIAAFAGAFLAGRSPLIYGDGSQSRDFTYVDNAVHANLLAARCPDPLNGQPINIACGRATTVKQLARMIARWFGRQDIMSIYRPARVGDIPHSLADLHRAAEILEYRPIVHMPAALAATLEWYFERR